ncbi:hypothetical protein Dimus_020693, partial [Dionaea muscipula]
MFVFDSNHFFFCIIDVHHLPIYLFVKLLCRDRFIDLARACHPPCAVFGILPELCTMKVAALEFTSISGAGQKWDVHYHMFGSHGLEKRSSLTKKTWILFLMIRDGQRI